MIPRARDDFVGEELPRKMRQVDGYSLWLGHVGDARDLGGLFAERIVAVVDLARNESPVILPREFIYCRFPLIDGGGNPAWLLRAVVETVAALLRAESPTLVYCSAGMSRSPAVVGAAIAMVQGCSPIEGLAIAVQSGPVDASPVLWSEIQAALA